jgi:hypothetical protein
MAPPASVRVAPNIPLPPIGINPPVAVERIKKYHK